MQFTVRLPRWLATTFAIVVASVAVAALLPAIASSDSSVSIGACVDPTSGVLTEDPSCTGTKLVWNQAGPAGLPGAAGAAGATGATGPAGPAGASGASFHLDKSKPALTARLETALAVQSGTLTDINHDLRASLATTSTLAPSADPTTAALQKAVDVQAVQIGRLVNVLRALTKAQNQLLQGLE